VALVDSDADLVAQIASAGDVARAAERLLVQRFASRIRLYGRRHLRDEAAADDLVQQVLLRVIEAIRGGRVEQPDRLASFVLGTCRHVTWDLRRGDLRQRAIAAEVTAMHVDVQPPETTEIDLARLRGCMGRLDGRDRQVVRMTFMEDRSTEDIATCLGVTAGNVRVIRHRALARLGGCLGVQGIAP
jgi:RNA polymerase sigma-70 factor (ECF subfamily)